MNYMFEGEKNIRLTYKGEMQNGGVFGWSGQFNGTVANFLEPCIQTRRYGWFARTRACRSLLLDNQLNIID
ncbi:hypothetical protein BSK63_19150 [Paenibacillus odorifer]|nr:hypothetical protein BSK63_19150 [Paenibacillus odorifer]